MLKIILIHEIAEITKIIISTNYCMVSSKMTDEEFKYHKAIKLNN